VENITAWGGKVADTFLIQATSPGGGSAIYYGAGGNDSYRLGNPAGVQDIRSTVYLYNDDGVDSALVDDSPSTNGKRLHVDQDFVGGHADDTFFGAGGQLRHVNFGSLEVRLGSGSDTVVAHPSATTAITISGGPPTMAPGDRIAVIVGGVPPAGVTTVGGVTTYTFTALRDLAYSGFESFGIPGDYDLDGDVDGSDFLLWQRMLGTNVAPPGAGADGNANGTVDSADLAVWRSNFGSAGSKAAIFSGSAHGAVRHATAARDAIFSAGDFTAATALSSELTCPRRARFRIAHMART
jgi:hypothetical protein